ncbi:MAG: RHS repeat-associated core domain-containing protein [Chloroflexota bacterium]
MLDGSGNTVATYAHYPYGNLSSSTGSVANPFKYAGQYTDAESGLQYLRARYYDPGTQQFLTADPLTAETGQPYVYVGDNPINAVDPNGACAQTDSFHSKYPPCKGNFYGTEGYTKIKFGRYGYKIKHGRPEQHGKFAWNLTITPKAKRLFGPETIVTITDALINGREISSPYGPHLRTTDYDFHASLQKYNHKGGGNGTIKRGDVLSLLWEVESYNPVTQKLYYGIVQVTCTVPQPDGCRCRPSCRQRMTSG